MNCRSICSHRKLCEHLYPKFNGEEKDLEAIWECPMAAKCGDLEMDAYSASMDYTEEEEIEE